MICFVLVVLWSSAWPDVPFHWGLGANRYSEIGQRLAKLREFWTTLGRFVGLFIKSLEATIQKDGVLPPLVVVQRPGTLSIKWDINKTNINSIRSFALLTSLAVLVSSRFEWYVGIWFGKADKSWRHIICHWIDTSLLAIIKITLHSVLEFYLLTHAYSTVDLNLL